MDRNRAERRFCWKISAELKSFKFRMMQMSKQEIYDHAYEIDCMIRIYEELVNISERAVAKLYGDFQPFIVGL